MKAGNQTYNNASELPDSIGLFALEGALLLPGGNMPLNIFENRYHSLINDALAGNRLLGIVQPQFDEARIEAAKQDNKQQNQDAPPLCDIGCLGRITAIRETGDGRYLVNISGICRFRIEREIELENEYRTVVISSYAEDLIVHKDADANVNRDELLATLKAFLDANELEADWEDVKGATTETLVNSLAMMSPYGPAEKQALLEANDLKTRAETLVAITEIALARESGEQGSVLQ